MVALRGDVIAQALLVLYHGATILIEQIHAGAHVLYVELVVGVMGKAQHGTLK